MFQERSFSKSNHLSAVLIYDSANSSHVSCAIILLFCRLDIFISVPHSVKMKLKTFCLYILIIAIWLPIVFVSYLFIARRINETQKRELLTKYLKTGDELKFKVETEWFVYGRRRRTGDIKIGGDAISVFGTRFIDDLLLNGHSLRRGLWNLLAIQTGSITGAIFKCIDKFSDSNCQTTMNFISVRFVAFSLRKRKLSFISAADALM